MKASTKRTTRTVLQTTLGFALAVPAIVGVSGIPEHWPWIAGGVAAAGGFARVMCLPAVEQLLDRFGIGLSDDGPPLQGGR
ncbi:hypothetical protein ACWGI0_23320 [Streptomyces sp. NPDC054802]